MIRQHHQLSGHELKQTPGDSERQGSLQLIKINGKKKDRKPVIHKVTRVGHNLATEQHPNRHLMMPLISFFPSDGLPTPGFLGFPCGSAGKESAWNEGKLGLIPELGRSPGEGKGYPLQYSGLENSMDYTVHGVAKSQTLLNDFHFQ